MVMFIDHHGYGVDRDNSLDDLFGSGETGDWWWFHRTFTDTNLFNGEINSVDGQVNGLQLTCNTAWTGDNTPRIRLADGGAPSTTSPYDCAYFDGSDPDDLLYNFGSTIAQPGTIILSLYSTDTDTGIYCTGSASGSRWQISNDGSDNIIAYAGATLDSAFNSPIGGQVLTAEFNGASSVFRRNGTQTSTGNAGAQGTDQFLLGCAYDGTFPAEFYLFGALFIDRLLTSDERDRAERLLGAKGGITW